MTWDADVIERELFPSEPDSWSLPYSRVREQSLRAVQFRLQIPRHIRHRQVCHGQLQLAINRPVFWRRTVLVRDTSLADSSAEDGRRDPHQLARKPAI